MILDIHNSCKINLRVRYQFYINEFKHPYSCLDQRNKLITGMSTINMKKRKHFLYEIISQILEILPNFYKYSILLQRQIIFFFFKTVSLKKNICFYRCQ